MHLTGHWAICVCSVCERDSSVGLDGVVTKSYNVWLILILELVAKSLPPSPPIKFDKSLSIRDGSGCRTK